MKLSILTATIPGRENQVSSLIEKLEKQIGAMPVEHLVLFDNRRRLNGAKRQALLDIARGEYFAYVDDDDDVSDDYVKELLAAIEHGADVITFRQHATYNGLVSEVHFGIDNDDHPFEPGGITIRAPWHVCAWNRRIVAGCAFGDMAYNEDTVWCMRARKRIKTAFHIDKIMHYYRHSSETTAAPFPG